MHLIPEKNAVVVRPRNPARLVKIIPTAKLVKYKGRAAVAVPHNVDESRLLNNMGLKVPSPILHKYDWPRSKQQVPQPFEAQRQTAALMTLNPRAFILNDLGCVDAETEYLTPTGWRRIDQYAGGEVAQYIPETGAIEFVADPEYVKLPCERMLRVKTKYGVDQLLSPEHRVLITDRAGTKQETLQAHELFARQEQWVAGEKQRKSRSAVGYCKASIPAVYTAPGGDGLSLTDAQLRLQIAVIADGHFPNQSGTCVVRLKKTRKKARLRALLQQAGVEYSENDKTTVPGFSVFSFTAPRRDKEFTADYWHCTSTQLAVVRDEVLHWDGCIRKGKPTCEFSSNSKASADFVQYAFNAGGRVARITVDDRGPTYCVLVRDNGAPLQLAGSGIGGRKRAITPAPSTDGFKYCFMVPSTYLILRRNGCVFASGNTGKSLSALWAYDYLRAKGKARKLLIVCPMSTMERTWADELFFHFMHLDFTVLHGTRAKRLRLLEETSPDVYIINHHGVKIVADALAQRPDITHVVIDEVAQVARNQRTSMWRSLNTVVNAQKCEFGTRSAWGLTATPTPNEPTDAYAQVKLIKPDNMRTTFRGFQQRVMRQIGPYLWASRPGAVDVVSEVMSPAIRFRREDCVDLPPTIYVERRAEMGAEQTKAYQSMHKQLAAQLAGGQILAVNEAVKVGKLVQIACGVVYDENRKEHVVGAEDRINVTVQAVADSNSKTIIFVPYIAPLNYLRDALNKRGISTAVICGAVPKHERDAIFNAFQKEDEPRVIVAQPNAMSHGLTLTAASTIVWYAPTTNADIYEQANGRITRPGQKHTTVIVNVGGTPVEHRIYTRLRTKQKMQNLLLEEKVFREAT